MRFPTTLLLHGKTATGVVVPEEVVEELGGGKRPAVQVTINHHTYRSTVAPRRDRFLLGVSAENREQAGVTAGSEIEVELQLDTAARTVEVPPDLAAVLSTEPEAKRFFDSLTASQQKGFVTPIEQAKQTETRTAGQEGNERPPGRA